MLHWILVAAIVLAASLIFELTSRCYISELNNHWGSADHILVVDVSGYAHFHGVAR